jgi:hypothetical protein
MVTRSACCACSSSWIRRLSAFVTLRSVGQARLAIEVTRSRAARIAALVATLAIAPTTVGVHAQADRYQVVGTGDSILAKVLKVRSAGGWILTADRWIDLEYGRAPYVAGLQERASTASLWPLLLGRSQPDGWIIIQDNSLGASDYGWEALMGRIVDETPDDRCLLFIPPVFHPAWRPDLTALMQQRTLILLREAVRQPCRAIIPWDRTVLADASMVTDGQHPSLRGQIWLTRAIDAAIG